MLTVWREPVAPRCLISSSSLHVAGFSHPHPASFQLFAMEFSNGFCSSSSVSDLPGSQSVIWLQRSSLGRFSGIGHFLEAITNIFS